MSKLKCPFCQQELLLSSLRDGDEEHQMWSCLSCQLSAQRKLWQELIHTRKALEQSEICCTEWEKEALDYKAENITLSSDLELTHKALEIAVNALKFYSDKPGNWLYGEFQGDYNETPSEIADEALNKIKTTLEQKDK